jgi:carbohydrate-selective porin OprB
VAGWLDLRPNLQYVADPGGVAGRVNDVIFGIRVAMNF